MQRAVDSNKNVNSILRSILLKNYDDEGTATLVEDSVVEPRLGAAQCLRLVEKTRSRASISYGVKHEYIFVFHRSLPSIRIVISLPY